MRQEIDVDAIKRTHAASYQPIKVEIVNTAETGPILYDSDDMTWDSISTRVKRMEEKLRQDCGVDDEGMCKCGFDFDTSCLYPDCYTETRHGEQTQDNVLNLAAIAKTLRDLQQLVYGLQAEVVTLRERLDRQEADS